MKMRTLLGATVIGLLCAFLAKAGAVCDLSADVTECLTGIDSRARMLQMQKEDAEFDGMKWTVPLEKFTDFVDAKCAFYLDALTCHEEKAPACLSGFREREGAFVVTDGIMEYRIANCETRGEDHLAGYRI